MTQRLSFFVALVLLAGLFAPQAQAQNVKKKDLLAQLPGAIQRQMVFCIFGEVCLRVCGAHDVQTHVPTDSYT